MRWQSLISPPSSPPVITAQATDFNGSTDYLSKVTDYTGSAIGKTFTFSCWVYLDAIGVQQIIYSDFDPSVDITGLSVYVDTTGVIAVQAYATGGLTVFQTETGVAGKLAARTWNHIFISGNTGSALLLIYINDHNRPSIGGTIANLGINFPRTPHMIAGTSGTAWPLLGRVAHVYLDYVFRNPSTVANRRLFITADLYPASGQASLNPIVYFPLSSGSSAGTNAGTGGNIQITGLPVTSGRGPNQYNTNMVQYSSTAPMQKAAAASSTISATVSFWYRPSATGAIVICQMGTFGTQSVGINTNTTNHLLLNMQTASGSTTYLSAVSSTVFVPGRLYHVAIAIDMSTTARRQVYINGVAETMTWTTYNTSGSWATNQIHYFFSNESGASPLAGSLGDYYETHSYIDLSTNLTKFSIGTGSNCKPVDLGITGSNPTGSSPFIFFRGSAEKFTINFGTGGDATGSIVLTGSRSPSEFWGNSLFTNSDSNRLTRSSALVGATTSKLLTLSAWISITAFNATLNSLVSLNPSVPDLSIGFNLSGFLTITALNSAGTVILSAIDTASFGTGTVPKHLLLSIDLSNSSNRSVRVNDAARTMTWTTYTNDSIKLSASTCAIMGTGSSTLNLNGSLGELWINMSYIDVSQNINNLKFRDKFNEPVNLNSDGSSITGSAPLIYMRMDPAAPGTNSGTGGNFTVNGTLTDKGQF